MAKKPARTFVTKAQVQAKVAQRSAERQSVKAENVELKQNQALIPKGEDYSLGFDSSKEALTAYPKAASHDPGFHDTLQAHINELRSRLGKVSLMNVDGEEAAKAGITEAAKNRVRAASPRVSVHLDAAANELARSFAAHQDGTAGGAEAYYTAHVAYTNAHKHVTDATKAMADAGILDTIGNPKVGRSDRLLGTQQRQNLVTEYGEHLKKSALNNKVRLPKSVLASETPNLSHTTGEYSDVGQQELRRRGIPATEEEAAQRAENLKSLAQKVSMSNFRESAMRGKYTPTREEMEAGSQRKSSRTPYAGVGITGFTDVATAAKAHFEANNPGQSWFNSPHSKGHDVLALAKSHFESNNEGSSWRSKDQVKAVRYLKKKAPHLLSPENHPTIQYAMKNNVGVFKRPESVVGGTLRLMGEGRLAGQAGKITSGKLSADPVTPKSETENIESKISEMDAAPRAVSVTKTPKASRSVIFQEGQAK